MSDKLSSFIKQQILLVSVILALLISGNIITYYVPIHAQKTNSTIKYGIASGDVTSHSAVIWSRTNRLSYMHVDYDSNSTFLHPKNQTAIANQTTDFTGHAKLENLIPDTTYYYRVWFSSIGDVNNRSLNSTLGSFHTAPSPDHSSNRTLSFIIGGDLGGSRLCKRVGLGYPIFSVMNPLSPTFFIFNGDQIYADFPCPSNDRNLSFNKNTSIFYGWHNMPGAESTVTSPDVNWNNTGQIHKIYLQHWEYNRADPHLQGFLANTSMYSQADDHEVIDDYGGNWSYYNSTKRPGYHNLVTSGITTFFNFSPIDKNKEDPTRIYRSFDWGKDLDLFILDQRSYRSRSELPDTPDQNKTLLGEKQLQWLEQGLLNSKATWKIVSADVPVTIPNCFNRNGLGCDSWATNGNKSSSEKGTFVRERTVFLKFLDDHNIKNVIFVVTDVHFCS